MANVRLFRKEALRHQFRAQDLGEAVIEQPRLLDQAILYLFGGLALIGLAVAAIPLSNARAVLAQPASDNYQPVVMARPAVVAQQLLRAGSTALPQQPVARVQLFSDAGVPEISEVVRSPEAGTYFPAKEQGQLVPAYEPIGYVLRGSSEHQYGFWLEDAGRETEFRSGEGVRMTIGTLILQGRIVEVSEGLGDRRQKLTIELLSAADRVHLSPHARVALLGGEQRGNVFALLSRHP